MSSDLLNVFYLVNSFRLQIRVCSNYPMSSHVVRGVYDSFTTLQSLVVLMQDLFDFIFAPINE